AKQLLGDRRGAAVQFETQLQMLRRSGGGAGVAAALANLGHVQRLLGEPGARANLEEALRLASASGDHAVLPSLNINLGVLHMESSAGGPARLHFEAAAKQAREQGRETMVVVAKYQLGRLDLLAGALVAARERFTSALDLAAGS